jgi:hypothetical protein
MKRPIILKWNILMVRNGSQNSLYVGLRVKKLHHLKFLVRPVLLA